MGERPKSAVLVREVDSIPIRRQNQFASQSSLHHGQNQFGSQSSFQHEQTLFQSSMHRERNPSLSSLPHDQYRSSQSSLHHNKYLGPRTLSASNLNALSDRLGVYCTDGTAIESVEGLKTVAPNFSLFNCRSMCTTIFGFCLQCWFAMARTPVAQHSVLLFPDQKSLRNSQQSESSHCSAATQLQRTAIGGGTCENSFHSNGAPLLFSARRRMWQPWLRQQVGHQS